MSAIITTAPMPMGEMQILARAVAASGLFGIKTPDAALVLMSIAQAEGRHPVEAARDYDVINGRPAKKAEAMMRDFIQAGGTVKWHSLTDELADATFTHPQTGSVRIDWDMRRAMTAFGKKDMYAKFPRQMLRSRVVSEGVRTLWPLATSGMYVPEEQADIPPEHNGPTIEAEPDAREQINREVPLKAAAPIQRAASVAEKAPAYEAPHDEPQPERRTWAQWADSLELAERDTKVPQDLGRLLRTDDITEIVKRAKEGPYHPTKTRIIKAYEKIEARYLADPPDPPEPEGDDLREVEIAGADKVGAG